MNNVRQIACGCVFCAASASAFSAGQSSTNFIMQRDAVNTGVGAMSSTNFVLASSVGDSISAVIITSVNFQLSSGFRGQVAVTPAMLNLLSVVSRKLHGATPFEITIDHTLPITGLVTVEPRVIGGGHTLVFRFDNTVNSVAAATAVDAMMTAVGTVSTPVASGSEATVVLSGVPDNKRLTVTLTGINGTGTAMASMGFLVGDVNNTRSTNAADISAVKARSGQTATALNFRFDVNATGAISASDISAVKARSGFSIP